MPVEVKTRLYTQARYDEEQEEWSLNANIVFDNAPLRRPVSVPTRRRPVSEYALHAIKQNDSNALRYKGENIVSFELDMPLRTTYDYTNPKVSLQAVLAETMHTEEDININDPVSLQRITLLKPRCCCCTNVLRVYVLYSLIRRACDPD